MDKTMETSMSGSMPAAPVNQTASPTTEVDVYSASQTPVEGEVVETKTEKEVLETKSQEKDSERETADQLLTISKREGIDKGFEKLASDHLFKPNKKEDDETDQVIKKADNAIKKVEDAKKSAEALGIEKENALPTDSEITAREMYELMLLMLKILAEREMKKKQRITLVQLLTKLFMLLVDEIASTEKKRWEEKEEKDDQNSNDMSFDLPILNSDLMKRVSPSLLQSLRNPQKAA